MELSVKTLPCGCITETNNLEKEPKAKTIRTCESHTTKEEFTVNQGEPQELTHDQLEATSQESPGTSFWIYIAVALLAVVGLAYLLISTYGLPTDLFSNLALPGFSEASSAPQ